MKSLALLFTLALALGGCRTVTGPGATTPRVDLPPEALTRWLPDDGGVTEIQYQETTAFGHVTDMRMQTVGRDLRLTFVFDRRLAPQGVTEDGGVDRWYAGAALATDEPLPMLALNSNSEQIALLGPYQETVGYAAWKQHDRTLTVQFPASLLPFTPTRLMLLANAPHDYNPRDNPGCTGQWAISLRGHGAGPNRVEFKQGGAVRTETTDGGGYTTRFSSTARSPRSPSASRK